MIADKDEFALPCVLADLGIHIVSLLTHDGKPVLPAEADMNAKTLPPSLSTTDLQDVTTAATPTEGYLPRRAFFGTLHSILLVDILTPAHLHRLL